LTSSTGEKKIGKTVFTRRKGTSFTGKGRKRETDVQVTHWVYDLFPRWGSRCEEMNEILRRLGKPRGSESGKGDQEETVSIPFTKPNKDPCDIATGCLKYKFPGERKFL